MPQRVQPTRVKKTRLQVASGLALRQVGSRRRTPAGELGCEPKPQLSMATADRSTEQVLDINRANQGPKQTHPRRDLPGLECGSL